MTPTHNTRDGRPVTIHKIGKRWMRGRIVQEGATWHPRWHLNGEHPRDEALDLTPVADPRDAEIERLRGEGLALANAWLDPRCGVSAMDELSRAFLARNGGAK